MLKYCILLLLVAAATISDAAVQRGSNSRNYYGSASTPKKFVQTYSSSSGGHSNDKDVQILRNDQQMKEDGSYNYAYETSNGIAGAEQGVGGVGVQGSSSWVSPEGVQIKTTYTADETGYHPVGEHIPQIPDYILRALEYIRTHPNKENDYEKSHGRSVTANTHKIATNISPPFPKSSPPARKATPTKYNAYKKSGGRFRF